VTYILIILLVLMTVPRFFDIYRTMAFNTVPRDDYAPYLLHAIGEKPGVTIYSPYGYRIFSFLAAYPFYKLLPVYRFSNLPPVDDAYLKATQALAMTSYLAILAACLMMFLITKKRLQLSVTVSLIATLITYVLFEFTNMFTVDPIAIFLIILLVYFLEQPMLFSAIVLMSVAFNEKVSLVFLLLLLIRLVIQRKSFRERWQLLSSTLAVGAYFLVRNLVGLPGFEYQTSIRSFYSSFVNTLIDTLSLKGAVQNILPIIILILLYFLAAQSLRINETPYFSRCDVLVLVGLILLAFVTRLEYTVGRIAMYSFPLYLPAACATVGYFFTDSTGSSQVE
jgi:hypothetical protein